MKFAIVLVLALSASFATAAQQVAVLSTAETRAKIESVFEQKKSVIADVIRRERPGQSDFNDDQIFSTRNCAPASREFSKYLTQNGVPNQVWITQGHVFIVVGALNEAGNPVPYVVDPTFRQFFGATAAQILRKQGNPSPTDIEVTEALNQAQLPFVLFAEHTLLRQTLESFQLQPDWLYVQSDDLLKFLVKPYSVWYEQGLQKFPQDKLDQLK